MGVHGVACDSRGGAHVDAVGLARGRSHAIPPWPDQQAHEAKYWVANEALAIYCFGKSMAPMFVEISVAFVEPRGQYHNYYICPDGAAWMDCTVFCEARLAIYLRMKLFSCVWSDRCPREGTPALESCCTVPPRRSVELLPVWVGCPEFTSS